MRRIAWWLIIFVICLTSASGLWNGLRDWMDSKSFETKAVALAVMIYGVAGSLAFIAVIGKRRWIVIPLLVWGAAILFAATVAPFVYSPDEAGWIGAAGAGISTGALLILIVIQVRREAQAWKRPLP